MLTLLLSLTIHDHATGIRSEFADCLVFRDDTELHASCLPRSEAAAGPAIAGTPLSRVVIYDGAFLERVDCTRAGDRVDCGERVFAGGFE